MKSVPRTICTLLLFLGLANAVWAADQATSTASKAPVVVAAASPTSHTQTRPQSQSRGTRAGTGQAGSTNYHPSNYHPSSYHPSSYNSTNSNYHATSSNYHGTNSNYHSTNSNYHPTASNYHSTNGSSAETFHASSKSANYGGESYHQANSHAVAGIINGRISRRSDAAFYRDVTRFHDTGSTLRLNREYARYATHYNGYWGGGWYHGYWHDYWAYQPWVWYNGFYGFWLPVAEVNVFVRETEPGACQYWNGDEWVPWWDPPYTPYYCPY
jgi:hypothetical protein